MTRHPDDYQGVGEPVRGDVTDADSLAAAAQGCDAAYYLVHSLERASFEEDDASAARAFGSAASPGRAPPDRLPRRTGQDERRAVLAPAQPP